jgi:branched-subunit amino acid transport protein AzlD
MQPKKKSPSKPQAVASVDYSKYFYWIGFAVIIFAFFPTYRYIYDEKVSVNEDNISYILLAKGIKSGVGYVDYNQVDQRPANHFPPGYPFILSILMFISEDVQFLKMTSGLFFIGSLLLFYVLGKRMNVPWQVTLVASIFTLCNYHVASHGYETMSEMPFLFISLLSIFFLLKLTNEKPFYKNPVFYGLLACIVLTYYIRAIGLSVLFGALVYLWVELKNRKAALALFVGFILLALPWYFRGKIIDVPSGYETQVIMINPYRPEMGKAGVKDFIERIGKNTDRYLSREIPSAVVPSLVISYEKEVPKWLYAVGILSLLLAIAGMLYLKKYRWFILAYFIGLAGILALWPDVWFSTRFMMPFIPFLLLFIIFAMVKGVERIPKFPKNYAPWTALLLLFFLNYYLKFDKAPDFENQETAYPLERANIESNNGYNPNWKNYFDVAEWAKKNLPENSIVACRKPLLFHYFSGASTDYYPYDEDVDLFIENLAKTKAQYVVVDQLGFTSTSRYLVPAIQKKENLFEVIYATEEPQTYLLKFKAPGNTTE